MCVFVQLLNTTITESAKQNKIDEAKARRTRIMEHMANMQRNFIDKFNQSIKEVL